MSQAVADAVRDFGQLSRAEFRGLRGGEDFEPQEANPMIGYRGALRYMQQPELLGLELEAIGRVWDAGHENFHVMIPFVRTPRELVACRAQFEAAGLLARPGFELWVMAEVPSVLFHLPRYAEIPPGSVAARSSRRCSAEAISRRARDRVHVDRVMETHRFSLDQIEEAYDLFGNQREGVVKVGLTP